MNKWLETELVFDCDEVAAEMHISLVRYEQEMQVFPHRPESKVWGVGFGNKRILVV